MLAGQHDPIAAIATATGRGAVGIVRISGRELAPLMQALCGRRLKPREATYLPFHAADGSPVDHGLAIYFPAPHSYTGEDVLELQGHGGPVVLQLLLARCVQAGQEQDAQSMKPRLAGLRLARPGEFTQRAFLNDKMDLAQAEAIADLIDASTEAAARSASRSLAGEFSREIHGLRDALVHLRVQVEATLDFPEEEIDFLEKADARGQLSRLQLQLDTVMQQARQGALLREGIKIVIAGQPNSGKSSLLNALAGAELAIVTPVEGTTRDKVQQTIQIDGVPVHVIDTAGLRRSEDEVEKIGIARAWSEIAAADAVLFLHDLTRRHIEKYRQDEASIARSLGDMLPTHIPIVEVWNKMDIEGVNLPQTGLLISAKTAKGLDQLKQKLLEIAGWQAAPEGVFMARQRHVQALQQAKTHLDAAAKHLSSRAQALELLAEELRLGQNALNEITGEFTSDDLLGRIFSSFCIGK
jgi:tRNA modification GTPase